ncbi:ABC transporter permease [Spirosoma sp. SC4-14]|uniref:ABC transporter permease n=1 Tax=Spirosoma sp. SC4-14 TaxID=3128900 RepID=UPI0030D60180
MNSLLTAIWAELLKVRRSRVVWLTWLAFSFLPLMAGFFMILLQNPGLVSGGMMNEKAKLLTGKADWISFIGLITQGVAVGGLLVFGFLTSWIFGREYADHTLKDLLALPMARSTIMLAKFIVVSGVCLLLLAAIVLEGFLIGKWLHLAVWPGNAWLASLMLLVKTAGLTILLSFPAALLATIGRGYLAPIGFVVLTLVLAQIIAAAGLGSYFPWAVPGLNTGMAGSVAIPRVSFLLVWLTGLAGFVSTVLWCQYADFDK